jgi:hypothetical protein
MEDRSRERHAGAVSRWLTQVYTILLSFSHDQQRNAQVVGHPFGLAGVYQASEPASLLVCEHHHNRWPKYTDSLLQIIGQRKRQICDAVDNSIRPLGFPGLQEM